MQKFPFRPTVWACLLVFSAICGVLSISLRADDDPRCSLWIDLYRGEPIDYEEITDDLAGVRVVYIGESHRLERHHEWQERIIRDLAARGKEIVLGLEQMEFFHQDALTRYAEGEIDFERLAKETDWGERWSNYEQYRPVLEAARKTGAPILALNARAETVRAVARTGLDSLTKKQRAELPEEMNFDDPLYETLLNMQLMVHMTVTPEMLQMWVNAQVTRDETMADRLASFLQSPEGENRIAVVIAGAGHVSYGLGVPQRVRRRMPDSTDRIVLFSESGDVELTEAEKAMARDIEITHEQLRTIDQPIGDYLHAVEPKATTVSL